MLNDIRDAGARPFLEEALAVEDIPVIVKAHDFFVWPGKPGTEQILIKALESSDGPGMAATLLNSGNSALAAAARDWASKRGYRVMSLPASPVRWRGSR